MTDVDESDNEIVSPVRSPKRKLSDIQSGLPNDTAPTSQSTYSVNKDSKSDQAYMFSCDKEDIWKRYFCLPRCAGDNLLRKSRPCPACSRPISLRKGNSCEHDDKAFEIQNIIPWGKGADRNVDNWNLVPLCSRHDEIEGEGLSEEDIWGCSERLEREGDMHAFDWMRKYYPCRLQEMAMRLQIAHGEAFGLQAGETLCLRFVRDVYGEGRPRQVTNIDLFNKSNCDESDEATCSTLDPASRYGEWAMRECGFKSDILNLAECFAEMTDREMLRVIEMKTKLATPRVSRRKFSASSTGTVQSTVRSPLPSRGVKSTSTSLVSGRNRTKRNIGEDLVKRALFADSSNRRRQPDSDDESDYRSADSDDDSDFGDEAREVDRAPSIKRSRSGNYDLDVDTMQRENVTPSIINSSCGPINS